MRTLRDALGRELVWKSRSLLSHEHDLVDAEPADGEPYATLVMRRALFVPHAVAESADGRWTFRHVGFLRERVVVREDGAGAPGAVYRRHWLRGVLRFEDGREFVWRRESFWSTTWTFQDPGGMILLRFRRRFSFPRISARVEFDPSSGRGSEAALLACLGWYLLLIARRRSAAT